MKLSLIAALLFVVLAPHTNAIDVLSHSEAATGSLTRAQVLRGDGTFVSFKHFAMPDDATDLWLRFRVRVASNAPSQWALSTPGFVAHASFYVPRPDGNYDEIRRGAAEPFVEAEGAFPRTGITFDTRDIGDRPFYVHLQYHQDQPLQLTLIPERSAVDTALLGRLVFGVFFGVMIAVGLVNFYMGLVLRDRGALLCLFYIVTIACNGVLTSGVGGVYLWPKLSIDPVIALSFTDALSFIAFLLFVRTFLGTPASLPVLDKLLIAVFGIVAITALPINFGRVIDGLAPLLLIAGMALVILAAALCTRRGNRSAWIFLFGFIPVAIGYFTREIQLAWIIQAIVFSLAIVERVRTLAIEKQHAEVANQRLRTLAYYDPLTNVLNRAAFNERLESAIHRAAERHETVALFYLDLDGFKSVNDSYGHQTGDLVLQVLVARLRNAVRESDEIARLGGDEFGVIAHASASEASVIRDNVARILETPMTVANHEIRLGLSIGEAAYPRDGRTGDELLAAADHRMYAMKVARQRITKSLFRTTEESRA